MLGEPRRGDVARRLKRIQGQVEGLTRMVDGGRYCVDVLAQVRAAEAALHAVGEIILSNHLETCVVNALQSNNRDDQREKIEELKRIYRGMRPK